MAYKKAIGIPTCKNACGKPSTWEVFDHRGYSKGKYCDTCVDKALETEVRVEQGGNR